MSSASLLGLCLLIFLPLLTVSIFPPPRSIHYTNEGELKLQSRFCLRLDEATHDQKTYWEQMLPQIASSKQPFHQKKYIHENSQTYIKCELTEAEQIHLIFRSPITIQGYQLTISSDGITLSYSTHSGFVYGVGTLLMLVRQHGGTNLPFVTIQDEPILGYRGIMIDSSRHFLSVGLIKRLIQSMSLTKLNVLHWHLSDDETFTLELESHPQLANYSKFHEGETYSRQDVDDVLKFARLNAVTVIPEIDTPAHVRSWGLSPMQASRNVTIENCPGGEGYNAQFDLSVESTYTLAKQVVSEINQIFSASPYIHLGGDQVFASCWNKRPSIQQYMKLHNIKTYGELQMYWRFQLKQALPADRKIVFWRNDAQNITVSPNDVLHFWGAQADTAKVTGNGNYKLILSPSDFLYLNKGQGNIWLNTTAGDYSVWRQIYEKFQIYPNGVDRSRILGATVCLWGEVSGEDTLQTNLWMRALAFSMRVWSEVSMDTADVVKSINSVAKVLRGMGVQTSPITSEYCQFYPERCFKAGTPARDISAPSEK